LALLPSSNVRPQTLNVRQYRRQQLRTGANQPEVFTPYSIPIPLTLPFVRQHHSHDCQALVQKEPYMAVNMPGREVCPVVHEYGDLQSHLCVPITTQDRTYGVLHLASRKPYAFWGSDFVLALNICKQIGVAAERARLFEEVDRLARTDALTGLYNKREFWERIEREIRRAGRRHVPLSLMIIDLDRLKWINDCFGHNHGDAILAQLGEMVRIESRASDIAFRYGGDELCILLPDTTREEAKIAAERLRTAARNIQIGQDSGQILIGNDTGLTMSIGIASFPQDSTDAVQLFERADAAMYRAKETGKDRAVLFDMNVDSHRLNYRRRAIENDLQDDRHPRRRTDTLPLNEQ
jgi:diguanylate cyclase (GGDEF)-like protein